MKASNKFILIFSFFALLLLLSGCINTSDSKTLAIENPEGYEGVLVSGASSLVETSSYEEVLVSGEEKANNLMDALNGKEPIEVSEDELEKRADDLKEPGSYRILLYNKPSVNSGSEDIFPILFYKDGTIQVDQEGVSYFIVNPPTDLLAQLKSDWKITF